MAVLVEAGMAENPEFLVLHPLICHDGSVVELDSGEVWRFRL